MKECEKIENPEDEAQPTSEGLGKNIGSIGDRAKDVSKKVGDAASSTVARGSEKVADAASSVRDASQRVGDTASSTVAQGSEKVADAAFSVLDVSRKAGDTAASTVVQGSEKVAGAAFSVLDASKKAGDAATSTVVQGSEKVAGAASSVRDASQRVGDAASSTVVQGSEKVADAAFSVLDASKKAGDAAASTVVQGSEKVADAASSVRDASQKAGDTVVQGSAKITDAVSSSVQDASQRAVDVGAAAGERMKTHSKQASDAASAAAHVLLSTPQAVLASHLSGTVNDMVQNMVKGAPTIYDKAMDANYIATRIGGGYHRLFDGGHTLWGAIEAGHAASPDDNIIQEAIGILRGLLRDVSTPRGLPIANWDRETYRQVAETLESNFHIPKSWFYDLNTYDAADLLGASVGVVALIFSWNRADTETFAKLVGGMGLSAVFTANPLLMILTVVALAKAFHKAHQTGEYAEFVDGQFKGIVGSGATLAAVSVVGVAGGPAGAALLAGLAAGFLVQYAVKDVKVVEIGKSAVQGRTWRRRRGVKVVEIGKSAAKQAEQARREAERRAAEIGEFAAKQAEQARREAERRAVEIGKSVAEQAVTAATEVKRMIEGTQLPTLGLGGAATVSDPAT